MEKLLKRREIPEHEEVLSIPKLKNEAYKVKDATLDLDNKEKEYE
ncbi:hypothetical protein [Bacillus sp. ISL-37]|nr:hypothetical protein [Bacillus sp. ISL-37]